MHRAKVAIVGFKTNESFISKVITFRGRHGAAEPVSDSGKSGLQRFRTIEVRQHDLVTQLWMLGRIARQRAHSELTVRLQRADNGAALLTGRTDDGDELPRVRHDVLQ